MDKGRAPKNFKWDMCEKPSVWEEGLKGGVRTVIVQDFGGHSIDKVCGCEDSIS